MYFNVTRYPVAMILACLLATAPVFAQTCIDVCNCERITRLDSCETDYQACLIQAGGNPDLEAICAMQRTGCLAANDDAFVACARPCPSTLPCTGFCGINYGIALSFCNDGYFACLMQGGSEATCRPALEVCQAAANARYRDCLLFQCVGEPTCSCDSAPCAQIAAVPVRQVCPSGRATITGAVTNCGSLTADIDIYVNGELVAAHTGVAPGAAVVGEGEVVHDCRSSPYRVKAVARTAACPAPFETESLQYLSCACSPDCLTGRASLTSLWPPSADLVPVSIDALDAGGQPVAVQLTGVTSDEPNSGRRGCVDATISPFGPATLRAQRDPRGDGRVYRVSFVDREHGCPGAVSVCVPLARVFPCTDGGQEFDPSVCVSPQGPGGKQAPVGLYPVIGSGIEIVVFEPAGSSVGIEVFDTRGRRVVRLEHHLPAGVGTILWDGRGQDGHMVSSGIYVVRTRVNGGVYAAKSVLVR